MLTVLVVLYLKLILVSSKHLISNHRNPVLVPVTKDIGKDWPSKHLNMFENVHVLKNATSVIQSGKVKGREEKEKCSLYSVLQYSLIVLILMCVLMLLSEWTDLSVLLETSRHHMIIY